MNIDWSDYRRVHATRPNLVIHLAAVPLFVASFVKLVISIVSVNAVAAVASLVLCIVAMALQGRGHRMEPESPLPFRGPLNFMRRWFTEQFVTFPVFFLSGRWWRQYRACGKMKRDDA